MTLVADVIVVGAGIIGASITQQLASRGVTVVALDKGNSPATGSTGASSSICRCRYTHPEVVRMAHHGQQAYRSWPDFTRLVEARARFHTTGVLWMMGEDRDAVSASATKLRSQGVEAEALGPDGVHEMFPALSTCSEPFDLSGQVPHECKDGEAFLFEPTGGYVDPVAANQDLIESARLYGGEVRFGATVTAIARSGETVTGVHLADGSLISAELVVNAAGPWCNVINRFAGADLTWSLTPTRIQTVYRSWPTDLGLLPTGADSSTGIYFRPESGGQSLLVGSVLAEDEEEVVEDPDDYKRTPDVEFSQMKLAAFHHRVPALEARGSVSGIAGLYTINREDVHPIVGPTEVDGFWVANGFSGHGFKLAPAIGSMVARAITGQSAEYDTDVPMSFFAVDRDPIELDVKHVLA
ncbi:MAG: FAD-dependent oxidoreductase [Acidimicrobiia bacterium]|nr:FAD-dependent oxidoreductase [Acidimicrobiia bacterium]